MALVYKTCAIDDNLPEYICDPCAEGELGGVRGTAFIHKSLKEEITKTNLELISWWEQHVNAGLIIVIPTTRGTFDGGTPNTVPGFGDVAEKITSKTFTLVFNDLNHKENQPFYQFLENNFKDYIPAFRTGSELRVGTDVLASCAVADNIEEDINSNVLWTGTTTWKQKSPNTLVPVYNLTDKVKNLFSNCIDKDTPTP